MTLNVPDTAAIRMSRAASSRRIVAGSVGSIWSGILGTPAQARLNWTSWRPCWATASSVSASVGRTNVLAKMPIFTIVLPRLYAAGNIGQPHRLAYFGRARDRHHRAHGRDAVVDAGATLRCSV